MPNKNTARIKVNENLCKIKPRNQNKIIIEFTPLIKYLASKMVSRCNYSIELNEMVSYGVLGLIDAIEKYDSTRDNKFKTYAEFRIRGAMLDYLRDQDFTPRSVRDKIKLLDKTTKELEKDLCRKPTATEIAQKLSISYEDYFQLENYTKKVCFLSLEAVSRDTDSTRVKPTLKIVSNDAKSNPAEKASIDSVKNTLEEAIASLTEREQKLIQMYYYEDMNMKEIAQALEVCESRASQLHAKAMQTLKARLENVKEDLEIAA
jgi:RNA polymerase sigma factor for flagellar operon FliA